MTVKQLVEEIQQRFPDKGATQILLDINQALKSYTMETLLIKASTDITPVEGQLQYDLITGGSYVVTPVSFISLTPETTTQAFTLPSIDDNDIVEIYRVDYLDADENASEYEYNFKVDKRTITFYGYDWNEIDTIEGVTTIRVHASILHPTVTLDSTLLISEQFQDALLFKVLSKYLALTGDYSGSAYFAKMYKEKETEGKKFNNSNRDSTSGRPVNRIL